MGTRTGCAVLVSVSCSVIMYCSRKLGQHNLPLEPPESPGWGDMGMGRGGPGLQSGCDLLAKGLLLFHSGQRGRGTEGTRGT